MLSHAARALPLFCLSFQLLPSALWAQPAISDIKVEAISHGTVAVRFQIAGFSGRTDSWIEYGPTHLLGFRTAIWGSSSRSPYRSLAVGGLKPDTQYYFRVVVQAVNGSESATWYCPDTSARFGYECAGQDAPPRFRTAPSPGLRPVPPAAPLVPDQPFPEIDGETFSVTADERGECVDLQEQLDLAAAADANRNHQVVIPAGATCYGHFVLPPKRGAGVVLIRPSTPLDRLPPQGVRIDPTFRPLMATLSVPRTWQTPTRLARFVLRTPHATGCDLPCTEGWRLVGLEITHPSHTDIPSRFARIVQVSEAAPGRTLLTLDRPLAIDRFQSVAIAGVEGAPELNGVRMAAPASETSLTVNASAPASAAGGYVTQALSIPIESCGPGPQPICRTGIPHGLPDPPPAAIEAIEGDRLTVAAGRAWPWTMTLELQGAPAGYDGLAPAYRSGQNIRLATPGRSAQCTADCGKARLRHSLQAFGFTDAPELNGSRLYTVLSETELRLDDVAAATPATGGGSLSVDPNSFPTLVTFTATGRNIVLDRCWLHGRGFPTRLQRALGLGSDDSAVVDSVISDVHSWRPINPAGGNSSAGAHGYFAATSNAITLGNVSRATIQNTLFENCIGITVYAEQFRTGSKLTPSDVTIAGNTFRNSDRFRAGSAESDGRYYPARHAIEFKRGQRIVIEGNVFDGNWADWTPLGPVVGLLTRAQGGVPNNRIQDVSIRDNVFRRVATAIQVTSTDDNLDGPSFPAARIAIENNFFENVDFYRMRSTPSSVNLFRPSGNFGGQILFLLGSVEDLTLRYNTAIDNRGRGPGFFWYGRGRSSGVAVTDNVFTHNHDFGLGGLPRASFASDPGPPPDSSAAAAFAHVFTQTPDPDPDSVFARNLVLPGVRDSSSAAAYDDASPDRNFSKEDCQAFYAGFSEIECAGSGHGGETANQRFAAAFPDLSNPVDPQGRGADVAAIRRIAGAIHDIRASLQESVLTVEYRTDAHETCFADLSDHEDFSSFQRAHDGGGEQRSVSFPDLQPGHSYHYRIKCPSDTHLGTIETQ